MSMEREERLADHEFKQIITAIKNGDDFTYQEIMLRWAKRSEIHDVVKSVGSLLGEQKERIDV